MGWARNFVSAGLIAVAGCNGLNHTEEMSVDEKNSWIRCGRVMALYEAALKEGIFSSSSEAKQYWRALSDVVEGDYSVLGRSLRLDEIEYNLHNLREGKEERHEKNRYKFDRDTKELRV
jgi:coenzyme F420-reducing hydrogenase gamma subunit